MKGFILIPELEEFIDSLLLFSMVYWESRSGEGKMYTYLTSTTTVYAVDDVYVVQHSR